VSTCWRCRPASSPATGPRPSAAGRPTAPPGVGPGCSSARRAWGSSCRAWRWSLEEGHELTETCITGRRVKASSEPPYRSAPSRRAPPAPSGWRAAGCLYRSAADRWREDELRLVVRDNGHHSFNKGQFTTSISPVKLRKSSLMLPYM